MTNKDIQLTWEEEFDKVFNNLKFKKFTVEWYKDNKKTDTTLEIDTTEIKDFIRSQIDKAYQQGYEKSNRGKA